MRKLVWSVLAMAGLMQSTGCIIGSSDDDGAFFAEWDITIDGAFVNTCSEAGVAEVEILSTPLGSTVGIADQFPCDNFQGTTFDLNPDLYTVVVSALDVDEFAVGSFAPFTAEIFSNEVTDLGLFIFEVVSGGPFTVGFQVDYGVAGGSANCLETGNGVVQQQVNVYDNGGAQCIVLDIFGTDQPDAATCEPTLCFENDVLQEIDLDAGEYDIEVWGFKGAVGPDPVLCYQQVFDVTVSGSEDVVFVVPFAPDPVDEAACNATKPANGQR